MQPSDSCAYAHRAAGISRGCTGRPNRGPVSSWRRFDLDGDAPDTLAERQGARTLRFIQLDQGASLIAMHVGLREGDRHTRTGLPPSDRHVSTDLARSIRKPFLTGS